MLTRVSNQTTNFFLGAGEQNMQNVFLLHENCYYKVRSDTNFLNEVHGILATIVKTQWRGISVALPKAIKKNVRDLSLLIEFYF